jgi:hypothetical protein
MIDEPSLVPRLCVGKPVLAPAFAGVNLSPRTRGVGIYFSASASTIAAANCTTAIGPVEVIISPSRST